MRGWVQGLWGNYTLAVDAQGGWRAEERRGAGLRRGLLRRHQHVAAAVLPPSRGARGRASRQRYHSLRIPIQALLPAHAWAGASCLLCPLPHQNVETRVPPPIPPIPRSPYPPYGRTMLPAKAECSHMGCMHVAYAHKGDANQFPALLFVLSKSQL